MTTATVTRRSVAAAAVGEQIDARRRAVIAIVALAVGLASTTIYAAVSAAASIAIDWRRGLRLPKLEIATGAATECGIDQEGEISWRASTMTW